MPRIYDRSKLRQKKEERERLKRELAERRHSTLPGLLWDASNEEKAKLVSRAMGQKDATEEPEARGSDKLGVSEAKCQKNECDVFHSYRWKSLWKRAFFDLQIPEFYGLLALCTRIVQTSLTRERPNISTLIARSSSFSGVF